MVKALLLIFGLLACLPVSGQQEEHLWMPEGYRLLSLEERRALPADELKAIHARNLALLEEALARMSSSERAALGQELERLGRTHDLSDVQKHYVALLSARLLAGGMQEHQVRQKREEKDRFEKLLKEQEETTRGFSSDSKSVEEEAWAVHARWGKEDSQSLYLRILRPLRARPWNDVARFVFQKVVNPSSATVEVNGVRRPLPQPMVDAALAFCQKRQAESPGEGSWFSQEAFLRMRRGELAEAKRLFRAAISKDARDGDSVVFPLLIAEIEGDEEQTMRLRKRALGRWPKAAELDRILFDQARALPAELPAKALHTFESRYKREYPADWASRALILDAAIQQGRFREVEQDTKSLLVLPPAALPEPHRSEFKALNLQARAGLGACGEVETELASFQTTAERVYPREFDPKAPPRPRTARDVQRWKASLDEARKVLAELEKSVSDGSFERAPELKGVSKDELRGHLAAASTQLESEKAEAMAILADRDDASAAAEWSRRELSEWEKAHGIKPEYSSYGFSPRAESLSVDVRSALGRCLLRAGRPREAARVLEACVGGGRNFHPACIEPLVEAGVLLVQGGNVVDASAIYRLVSPSFVGTDSLYEAIEKAAPGTVRRWTPDD